MEIKVTRIVDTDGMLTFTIKVTDLKEAPFTSGDLQAMEYIDNCKNTVEFLGDIESPLTGEVIGALQQIKDKTFNKVKEVLTFSIENSLKPKFEYICQEIYNHIYDFQKPQLKKYFQECDPQRTSYYFDNDKTCESDVEYE